MQRVFQVHILQGGKTEIISENRPQNEMPLVSPTGKDSPTRGPRQRSDEHERHTGHTLPLPRSQRSQRVRSETVGLISRACRRG